VVTGPSLGTRKGPDVEGLEINPFGVQERSNVDIKSGGSSFIYASILFVEDIFHCVP